MATFSGNQEFIGAGGELSAAQEAVVASLSSLATSGVGEFLRKISATTFASATPSGGGLGVTSFSSPNSTLTVSGTSVLLADIDVSHANTWTGQQTFNTSAAIFGVGIITPKIYPAANSTTAIKFLKADGTTSIVTIDTTNSRIGILTSTPSSALQIGTGDTSYGRGTLVNLVGTQSVNTGQLFIADTAAFTTGTGGKITLGGKFDGTGTFEMFGSIQGAKENSTSGNWAGALIFNTIPNGGNEVEAMRINSTGLVSIGLAPTTAMLNVLSTGTGTKTAIFKNIASQTANNFESQNSSGVVYFSIGPDTVGNVKIAGTAVRGTTEGTNHLDIFDGTAPVGTLANGISLYSTAGELRVMDSAGNATLLSPHDKKDNAWIYDSVDIKGRRLKIDVEKMLRFLNGRFGTDFIHEFTA